MKSLFLPYCLSLIILILLIAIVVLIALFSRDRFAGSVINASECDIPQFDEEEKINCINQVQALTTNLGTQYWGRAGNRGITYPGGAIAGSFGNPNVIN